MLLRIEAAEEASGWEDPEDEERVRYEDFTVPVATNFDEFLRMLREEP